jgi:phosphatidylinositol-4,5-bisphosphate 3-kinase
MNPYIVVGTGDEVGMVEIVPNSDTVARCQWAGGGPYDKNPLYDFILANALELHKAQFVKAKSVEDVVDHSVDNFLRSCAGYVVTTYVMGIGDRHPSNIMMQTDGHLFHIDFGHFLGNFKTKKIVGIKFKRERSPLVFTPQMLHVLDPLKDEYDKANASYVKAFLEFANSTYTLLRTRSSFFTSLFSLMVPAGLPELKSESDVDYMRSNLQLNVNDEIKAAAALESIINDSLKTSFKQIDDLMHMMAHKQGSKDGNSTLIEFYKTQKAEGKKAPFFYYVWENGKMHKRMQQEALFANVLSMGGLGHHNVNKSKRSKSVDSNSKKGAGRSKKRSSVISSTNASAEHRRSKTVNFLDSLNEIDATQLNEEKTDLRDRSSTVSIASNRSSTLDLDSFATNPMMSSAKVIDQPNVKASKWSKEADVYAEQLKEKRHSSNKSRRNSKRRSSWKEKHEKQVQFD